MYHDDDVDYVYSFEDMPSFRNIPKEDWGWPKDWGLVKIGNHLADRGVPDGSWCVQYQVAIGDTCAIETHYYPIPDNVLFLMRDQERKGSQDRVKQIKTALDL